MPTSEEKKASPTYAVLMDCQQSLRELLMIARAVVQKGGEEDQIIKECIQRSEAVLNRVRTHAQAIRPSPGLVAWGRGNDGAVASYRPPAHVPKG